MALQVADINGQPRASRTIGVAVPFASSNHASADGAAVVTLAANTTKPIVLGQIHYSYSAAPAAGSTLKVEDGSTTVFEVHVTAAGPGSFTFDPPLAGTKNTAMTITLSDPGGSIIGKVTANAWLEG